MLLRCLEENKVLLIYRIFCTRMEISGLLYFIQNDHLNCSSNKDILKHIEPINVIPELDREHSLL